MIKIISFKKVYQLPFKFDIPNLTQDFLNHSSLFKAWLKFLRRMLHLSISGQKSLQIENILSEHSRILWINLSANSLGDSLMDLSSRIFLRDRSVDLFTDKKNSHIFENDEIFSSVFSNKKHVSDFEYDLVIIDSFSSRSLKIKSAIAPRTKFVAMFGFYNGPEVNRVLFSFHQMNNLLGYPKTKFEINKLAKCSIHVSSNDRSLVKELNLPDSFISISLGGEWPHRTYEKWDKVIEGILELDPKINIVLVGSNNAIDQVKNITERFNNNSIFDFVGKMSFNQTAEIINRSIILLCCDGGLMHAANSVETPTVSIFARLRPEMQLTDSILSLSEYDETNVNNISYKKIILCFQELAKSFDNNLLV